MAPDPRDLLSVLDDAVSSCARRLPPSVDRSDLRSAALIALMVELARHNGPADKLRGRCFVRCRGAVLDELRRLDPMTRAQRAAAKRAKEQGHELEPLPEPIPDVETLSDPAAVSPAKEAEQADEWSALHAAIDQLPPQQARAIRRYHLDGQTIPAIAAELHVSGARVHQLLTTGLRRLGQILQR